MCGRFGLFSSLEIIMDEFGVEKVMYDEGPRYNIAPEQDIAAVYQKENRILGSLRWGLIPHWSKERDTDYKMINARAETLEEKSSYKGPLKGSRCIVPADGFYEWRDAGKRKVPYFIRREDGKPFGMASLYDEWKGENERILSCTIITTDPNDLVGKIHDRMPAILEPGDHDRWLDPDLGDVEEIKSMLSPIGSEILEAYEVSTMVNDPTKEGPDVIEPAPDKWF